MQRRYSLAHLILAIVVVLVLTLLMINVDAQARIAFCLIEIGTLGNLRDGQRWG